MSQEPDADLLDADTDAYDVPDIFAAHYEQFDDTQAAYEQTADQQAASGGLESAERPQPRHARPRGFRPSVTLLLSVALVVAAGFGWYLWLRLESVRAEAGTAGPLAAELAQTQAELADRDATLRDTQAQVVDAEGAAGALQEQLDEATRAAADAQDELADAADELQAASDATAEARRLGEALASAVLGTVDPLDACVRASARVAERVDQVGRGQLMEEARQAAATCAAAQDTSGPAVSQARALLAD